MFFSKKLRLASAFLGVAMLGSVFAGCGSDAGSGDTIKVGANIEMTGNQANYGKAGLEGLKLAIKEANDAGGINGKQITLVEADTKSEAAEAVNAATKLISDDQVKVIVGPAVTANVIAESQVATDNKVPVIGFAATNPDVTVENGQVKPFIFRSCFIDPQQGTVMAQFATQELKAKTAVLYIDSSSDYSKSLGKVFKETFEAAGGKVLMEESFLAKDQDFKAALTKLKTANADVIYTDIWVSMGEPDDIWEKRISLLEPYRVTKEVMANANENAIFLHCLPSFHDTNTTIGADIAKKFGVTEMEVADEVFESKQSKVFDEAENRMHTIKAVMYATLK